MGKRKNSVTNITIQPYYNNPIVNIIVQYYNNPILQYPTAISNTFFTGAARRTRGKRRRIKATQEED